MSRAREWADRLGQQPKFEDPAFDSYVADTGDLVISRSPMLGHPGIHVRLTADRALAYGRWILDTFGEQDRREQAIVDATMPRPAQVLYGVVVKSDPPNGWMLGMDFFETPLEVAALLLRGFMLGKPLAEMETRIVRLEVEP